MRNSRSTPVTPRLTDPWVGSLRRALSGMRGAILAVAILSGIANLMMLVPTLYMLQVYDRVLKSGSETTLLVISALSLGLLIVMAIAEALRTKIMVAAGERFAQQLDDAVVLASFEDQAARPTGDQSRPQNDLIELRQYLTGAGMLALMDLPWTPIYLVVISLLHPSLGVLGLIFVGVQIVLVIGSYLLTRKVQKRAELARLDEGRLLAAQSRGAEVVEAMGMAPVFQGRWELFHREAIHRQLLAVRRYGATAAVSKFARYAQQSLALGAGALLAIEGEISLGAMIAASILTTRALAPIDQVVGSWKATTSARAAYGRLKTLFEEASDAAARRVPHLPNVGPNERPLLAVEGLTVHVEGRPSPTLQDVSLRLQPGEVLVVMGPSGSGKTTFARAILGIQPSDGRVAIDGSSPIDWSDPVRGRTVGYLPQDPQLFEGTVGENIARMGEVDSELVVEASEAADLHRLILAMPQGYDTPIGDNGLGLSGGQRQRIGLARALYGNPKLVVLDEPNASLDEFGERALVSAIQRLSQAGTAFVLISHRPNVLSLASHVLRLDNGRVESLTLGEGGATRRLSHTDPSPNPDPLAA